jgi:hypothetical protein
VPGRGNPSPSAPGMMDGSGMMGSATPADMSTYMGLFNHHTEIHRTVQEIPGGVRTTTESDNPALAGQVKAHVAAMYQHVEQGQEVTCMSWSRRPCSAAQPATAGSSRSQPRALRCPRQTKSVSAGSSTKWA